jgi:chromosome segregation ATPase
MSDSKSYLTKMSEQLSKWDKDLDVLKARIDKMSTETRQEYQSVLSDLKAKRDQVENRIKESRSAGSEAWNAFKQRLDSSYNEFTKAFGDAREKLKDSDS